MGFLRDAVKSAVKGALKTTVETSKAVAQELLERRKGGSEPESKRGAGVSSPGGASSSPQSAVGMDAASWQAIGQVQTRRWAELVTRVDGRWRENEVRVRHSAGGEILAGEWLAVGERLMEQWQEVGARLSRCWNGLATRAVQPDGSPTPWITLEADLDGALQQGWRQFRVEWGEARARIFDALQPRAQQPAVKALQQRLDEIFRRGESILSDAWLPGQGYLQSALAESLAQPGLTRASFQQAGQDAWQPLLNGMDKAWDQVLGQLERGLDG